MWIRSEELAISRVQERIRLGGHSVPESTIRRRYHAGLRNFFNLYRPIANAWKIYDNSDGKQYRLIASEENGNSNTHIEDSILWQQLIEKYHDK